MPTSAAPASRSASAAARVRNGWPPDRYASLPQCRSQPVWTSTARPRTSSPANASAPIAAPSSGSGRTTSTGLPASGHSGWWARSSPSA